MYGKEIDQIIGDSLAHWPPCRKSSLPPISQTTSIVEAVGYKRITEHAGAKNGGGVWMTRAEAKQTAKRQRRQADQAEALREEAGKPEDCWAMANAREAVREERW